VGDKTAGRPLKLLRVVIASPRDAALERTIAQKAIGRVNELSRLQNRDYHLEAVDFKTALPNAGNPQRVSQEHLKIKESDLFMCIFWRRFGDPPGELMKDGTEVKSGTEDEFNTAYKANKENPHHHPRVMLYRKTDPPTAPQSDEDYLQYANLLTFIKECGPAGKHPTYVAEFKENEFETLLINHLIEACTEMENEEKEARLQENNDWYQSVGLRENPFPIDIFSQDFLEEYLIQFAGIGWQQFRNLQENTNSIYIFGERGSGKSTLREKLKRNASSDDQEKRFLVCPLQAARFNTFITKAGGELSDFQDWVFAYMIFDKAVNLLVASSESSSQPALADVRSPDETLQDLIDWVKQETGYQNILVLVDELDEIKVVKEAEAPMQAIYTLLHAMAGLPKMDNLMIRYFLPAGVESLLSGQDPERFRLVEKNPAMHLLWTEDKLLELISQRMAVASNGRLTSLSQVYGGSQTNLSIDLELVRMARCNPRAALHLANRLLEIHISQPGPLPEAIQPATWEQVKFKWQSEQNLFFPLQAAINPFAIHAHGVRFKGEVFRLSKIHARLMAPMVQNYGSFCSRELLTKAGWPEDQQPPSEKNYYQTMGDLAKEVEKFAPGWLTNSRGIGYKLEDPGAAADHQEDSRP
jgi:hypothetical protein